ncbi:MAG TPA: polyprenyl synthetase family protein [Armatimonadota bacterium]|nr:polyprenyl synthetase family protein [Armatimonadota bacterium]
MNEKDSAGGILDRFREPVDEEIRRLLTGRADILLYEMVRYHLGMEEAEGGTAAAHTGKRVRAAMCCLSCEAAGGEAATAAGAAAPIELLHSFTLLHDDVADGDPVRRGRPTVWRRWGVGQAVTAGDAMFALANLAVGASEAAGVSAPVVSALLWELNEATLAVCEGQQLDLCYEGRSDVSVDDYLTMIERKTAALFAAACAMGARMAEAPDQQREALRRFGRELGLGFQIRDDVLGIWGEAEELGKPVGGDLRRNKRSLPIVHGLASAGESERERIAARLAEGVQSDEETAEIAARLEELGSRSLCEQMAGASLERALEALGDAAPEPRPAEDLRTVASYLVERTK